VRHTIAHSVRGRLRVRYPSHWLEPRYAAIESGLATMPGIRAVQGRPLTGSLRIDYDPHRLAAGSIVDRLDQMTAELVAPSGSRSTAARRRPQRQVLPSAPWLKMIGATSMLITACCLPVPAAVTAGLLAASGLPAFLRAGLTLGTRRRLNGDVLEASTLALLIARRNFTAAALLTWVRALGELVVARSVVTARKSLTDVVGAPEHIVLRRVGDRREAAPIGGLHVGDVVVIGAGQQLPVDGTIVSGEAMVNQQTVTGEALPVERQPGDQVFAATTVEYGEIEVRADKLGLDTSVGRIVRAIEAAAGEKPDIQLFAEKLADREVWRTLTLAGLGAAFSRSIDAGMAILVADYGTAARVGIPAAIMTSLRRAANEGILVKGPRTLELLARVNTVVFDKTGTLTTGTLHVTGVVSYDRSLDEDELIRLSAAAEHGFSHPVARAIGRLARERRVVVPPVLSTESALGLGVDVRIEDRRVLIGSRRFMELHRVPLERSRSDETAAHAVGASPIFVAIDGGLAGMLLLQDQLRDDAPEAVRALRARKMKNVIMLSGDHPEPSRVIAESLGLRHHYAELLPEAKARLVRELKAEGRVVAMVGDGVNDALALQAADVGMAVPGGAEVAAEAADIVLLSGGLDRVVRALDLARESIVAVRHTLGIAARANLGVVGLASLGWSRPLTSILLSHGTTVGAALVTAARGDTRTLPPEPRDLIRI
jgi:heavy metal translocating P-type ATPase